jgi:hypothetical protein
MAMGNTTRHDMVLLIPFEVEFLGFRSDTHRLQQSGWTLSVEMDQMRHGFTMGMVNSHTKLYAMTSLCELDVANIIDRHRPPPLIQVNHVSSNISMRIEAGMRPMYQMIDAAPSFISFEELEAQDFLPFRLDETIPEVLVEAADMDVINHLQAIVEMQKPKQAELRQEARRRESRSEPATIKQTRILELV